MKTLIVIQLRPLNCVSLGNVTILELSYDVSRRPNPSPYIQSRHLTIPGLFWVETSSK